MLTNLDRETPDLETAIRTERLDLVPLSPPFLRAALAGDLATAARVLGLPVPAELGGATDVLALRLRQLEEEPALQPWLLRAIVLRRRGEVAGHVGFHTAPGPDYLQPLAPGAVELGFEVYPPFRRSGLAREAAVALMEWAEEHHRVRRFVVSIRPDNAPSQALAAGLGFRKIGEHLDPVDGVEEVLALDRNAARDT